MRNHQRRSQDAQSKEKSKAFMKSLVEATAPLQHVNIVRHIIPDDGTFPNNALLPLLVYQQAHRAGEKNAGDLIKELLETNSWTYSWEDGIYDYHHYHSTAHEVLVVTRGSARVQFGGPDGVTLPVETGDVIIIPAGVAHKSLDSTDDFTCIGAYPAGQEYDMNYGREGERPKADENINALPMPENDPIYGGDGPLVKNWFSERDQATGIL
jgi:uncharacterized protein YjlB